MTTTIDIKRAYDPPVAGTTRASWWIGLLSLEAAHVDAWIKDIAPSGELRRWFGHDPAKWLEFRKRYLAELTHNARLAELQEILRSSRMVTLLFAAKDAEHNNAVVLREALTSISKHA